MLSESIHRSYLPGITLKHREGEWMRSTAKEKDQLL